MTEAAIDLVKVLGVSDVGARTRNDIFTGLSIPTPHGRAFGGQVLGQAIMAAGATVSDARDIHSMHCYFLRPGRADANMTIEVNRLHDARSFSTRGGHVYQNGEVIMSLIASFQERQEGLDHQEDFDVSSVPRPEELPSLNELYGDVFEGTRASWILSRPFDIRYTTSDIFVTVDEPTPRQALWIRTRDTLPDHSLIHRAALAFGSDYTLVETVLRAHGVPWSTASIRAASLDHAMWFHRPFRADEWLLYLHDSPTAQGGRGLTLGKFYDRQGRLVASVAQESTIRVDRSELQ